MIRVEKFGPSPLRLKIYSFREKNSSVIKADFEKAVSGLSPEGKNDGAGMGRVGFGRISTALRLLYEPGHRGGFLDLVFLLKKGGGMRAFFNPFQDHGGTGKARPFQAWGKAFWILIGTTVGLTAFYQSVRYSFQQDGVDNPSIQGWIDLGEPGGFTAEARPVLSPEKSFRLAVAPMLSPESSVSLYRPFVRYLAGRLGRVPQMNLQQAYWQTNDMVHYGKCDLAVVCDYPFVRGEREFGMKALVVPQTRGSITYRSVVVVPSSSRARSLLDLEGKRFAVVDMLSNSGWLFPAVWLKQRGKDPTTFFSHMVFSGSHDQSLKAVLNGYVDGAAVNSLVFERMAQEDPSFRSKVRIILTSPAYGAPPYVVSKNIDLQLEKRLLKTLLGMDQDPEGKKILEAMGIQRFVVPDMASYENVRVNARFWEGRP